MANIPKIQKALYPHIPKIDPSIPLNIYKNILYPFKFLTNISVSLKTLPGPHHYKQAIIGPPTNLHSNSGSG